MKLPNAYSKGVRVALAGCLVAGLSVPPAFAETEDSAATSFATVTSEDKAEAEGEGGTEVVDGGSGSQTPSAESEAGGSGEPGNNVEDEGGTKGDAVGDGTKGDVAEDGTDGSNQGEGDNSASEPSTPDSESTFGNVSAFGTEGNVNLGDEGEGEAEPASTEVVVGTIFTVDNIVYEVLELAGEGTLGSVAVGSNSDFTGTALQLGSTITYNGIDYKITAIAESAFASNTKIESVDLSGATNLNKIGNNAFQDCTSLTTVNASGLTNLEYLGAYAFSGCTSLKTFNTAGLTGVERIYGYTFKDCTSLTDFDFSQLTGLKVIGEGAFENCTSLKEANFYKGNQGITTQGISTLAAASGSQLTSIGKKAFYNTGLTTIDLSNMASLTTIGAEAFKVTKGLTSVDLSGCTALTTIGSKAFSQITPTSTQTVIILPEGLAYTDAVDKDFIELDAFNYDGVSTLSIENATEAFQKHTGYTISSNETNTSTVAASTASSSLTKVSSSESLSQVGDANHIQTIAGLTGLASLLALASAWGGRRVRMMRRENEQQ